jgi:hypothetical protein
MQKWAPVVCSAIDRHSGKSTDNIIVPPYSSESSERTFLPSIDDLANPENRKVSFCYLDMCVICDGC